MHLLCFIFKFYEDCLKISEKEKMPKFNLGGIFKKKEPSFRRETRGSSSNQPMRPSYNEELEEVGLIELGQIGRVSCRERVCQYV